MKKEKQQLKPRKYRRFLENIVNNYLPTDWTTWTKMDKFLETYNLLKLNQEESENLSKQITTNEIEAVIKKSPNKQSPGPNGLTGEFYQTF